EFRNRLDAIIQFGALTKETIRTVVDKFLVDLQVQLDEKKVLLDVDESAVDWFVAHGYSESMGARPMARLIQEKLKKELAEDILFGKLASNGGDVHVSCKNDELVLTINERKPQEKKELTRAKN
ncbi:unnamed protein product, partial [Scytosiphon promiscuus]